MDKKLANKDLEFFFEIYEYKSPVMVFFKMICTLGIYFIWWFYQMNLKLEKVDEDAPDSRRGLVILFFFPPMAILISFVMKFLIFPDSAKNQYLVNILIWSIVIFLSLKYVYDFCACFGKWTASNGFLWYLFIYPGYLSAILYFFDFYYALPLLFFTIIAIPSMEAYLASKEKKFRQAKEHDRFNRIAPENSTI